MKLIWSITVKIAVLALLAYCGIRIIFDAKSWVFTVLIGLVAFLSCPICAILHEMGHALFGKMVKVKALPDRSFIKDALIGWQSSSSCKIITYTDDKLRARIIFTAMGGPAVDLIFIVLGIIALCVPAVPAWLCVLMPAAVNLFALNAVPFTYANGKSDGEVILELAKQSDEAKVMLAVLRVQAFVLRGEDIATIDEKLLFSLPQIREDDAGFIALCELRGEYFAAKGDEVNAEKWRTRFENLKNEYSL